MKQRFTISFLLCLCFACNVWADYPRIRSLKPADILFRQLQSDIEAHYKALGRGKSGIFPTLNFFTYERKPEDTVFTLSARLNLPYESLATVNSLSQAGEFANCREVIIPNSPGIFVPERPANPLEEIMAAWRTGPEHTAERIIVATDHGEKAFFFYRGEKFHTVERAFFLKIIFLFPLDQAVVTSGFGPRSDPFTGHPSFHNGIDLAAPIGAMVLATQDGVVSETGFNDVIGKFVRLAHPGGYETLYGHLGGVFVTAKESVKAGRPLGKVGLTGRTTGPHLHFEVQKQGKRIDPSSLLP
jgi:murein DD-endopeptidase MepM/ murein hydrolase activator NlpD